MQEEYPWFEKAIQALEQTLRRQITIVDNQGLFHTPAGKLIFPLPRQSHRKQAVCDRGFCSRCIGFCRHEMNRQCRQRRGAFLKTCWKGVSEIVVPLRRGNQHWGMFYLGAWRASRFDPRKVPGMPAEFVAAYEDLPLWTEEAFRDLSPLLEAFAEGLIARLAAMNVLGQPALDQAGRIREYLSLHAASPEASVVGLARELHFSPSHTSRLIRRHFGRTFPALLLEERVNRAKVLLLSTKEKLAVIAAATGFADEYHFSKSFRKVTGQPPGKFRRASG